MNRVRTVLAALCLAVALCVPGLTAAQETPADATDAAPAAAATPAKTVGAEAPSPHRALPKSESELFRMLSESNRRIDDLQYSASQWKYVVDVLQERLQAMQPASLDIDTLMEEVRRAQSRGDKNAVAGAFRRVRDRFYSPINGAFQLNLSSSTDTDPDVRAYISRLEYELRNIWNEYTNPIYEWEQARTRELASNQLALSPMEFVSLPTAEELKALAAACSDAKQRLMVAAVTDRIKKAVDEAKLRQTTAENNLAVESANRDQINQSIDKGKKEINGLAIQLGLPLFCGTVLLLFAIPFFALRRKGAAPGTDDAPKEFQFGTLVEISTVLLLTMSILILGLADKLDGPVLGTLLGGISGYVLNRVRDAKKAPE